VDGKIQMIDRFRKGKEADNGALSEIWNLPAIKEMEAIVDRWVADIKGFSPSSFLKEPLLVQSVGEAQQTQDHMSRGSKFSA
jgi:hypothetical protein